MQTLSLRKIYSGNSKLYRKGINWLEEHSQVPGTVADEYILFARGDVNRPVM